MFPARRLPSDHRPPNMAAWPTNGRYRNERPGMALDPGEET
jgi:hypothetical protein